MLYLISPLWLISWYKWPHHVPEIAFAIIYILAVVLFFAVSMMGGYHLLGVAKGETSVEAQDYEIYRMKAKNRGEVCWSTIDFLLCIFADFSERNSSIHMILSKCPGYWERLHKERWTGNARTSNCFSTSVKTGSKCSSYLSIGSIDLAM